MLSSRAAKKLVFQQSKEKVHIHMYMGVKKKVFLNYATYINIFEYDGHLLRQVKLKISRNGCDT